MAKLSLNMFAMATELAQHDPIFEPMEVKYVEHFVDMAHAMTNMSGKGIDLWDETDQFFYDVIHLSSGKNIPLKIRTMVGLTPLFAVLAFHPGRFSNQSMLIDRMKWLESRRPDLFKLVASMATPGKNDSRLVAILHGERLKAVLRRMFDRDEFFRTTASDRSRPITAITRTFLQPAGDSSPLSTCRQNRIAVCSAATPIGAGRSGSPSTICWCARYRSSIAITAIRSRWNVRSAPAKCSPWAKPLGTWQTG